MQVHTIDTEIKNQVTVEQAWHYKIVPINYDGKVLQLITDLLGNTTELCSELEVILGKKVLVEHEEPKVVEELLLKHYPKANTNLALSHAEKSAKNLNINDNRFLEGLVTEARGLQSSDIHIEIYNERCRIRFRIDGVLIDRHEVKKAEYPTLVNKIKIAAACDISEKRMPQDGRIRIKSQNFNLDIRVSILPTLYGEKIVLRLLGSDASHIDIDRLGFDAAELKRYKTAVQKPNGVILISGPTGSGKTTTLYATLKQINKPIINVVTIEDPIEYTLDGINQVQLREDIGLGYAEALRTFLRQDPDIIMLGEIRDALTAQMAIRAAMTGHLVLSTIHTNSAWGTIARLVDMGVAPYLIASTLNLSVAQRLVRLLCPHCKIPKDFDAKELPEKYKNLQVSKKYCAVGCEHCYYTGFKGRRAIYEVIDVTKELVEKIKQNETQVDDYLRERGIRKLSANALSIFLEGETTFEETYPYLINEL